MARKQKIACLTVDLEQDYGDLCPAPAFAGLELVPPLLQFARDHEVPLSWFVQGALFETHPTVVGQVAAASPADVYLHGYGHADPRSVDQVEEMTKGSHAFEAFLGARPTGYRAPLGVITPAELTFLAANGFTFDSSIFPTWRPGRFFHWWRPNQPHHVNGGRLWEILISVVGRWMPVPLSISYLKLMGQPFRRAMRRMPLPEVVVIGMHMHDLESLPSSSCIRADAEGALLLARCYGARAASGWGVLKGLVTMLRARGYRFAAISGLLQSQAGAGA